MKPLSANARPAKIRSSYKEEGQAPYVRHALASIKSEDSATFAGRIRGSTCTRDPFIGYANTSGVFLTFGGTRSGRCAEGLRPAHGIRRARVSPKRSFTNISSTPHLRLACQPLSDESLEVPEFTQSRVGFFLAQRRDVKRNFVFGHWSLVIRYLKKQVLVFRTTIR